MRPKVSLSSCLQGTAQASANREAADLFCSHPRRERRFYDAFWVHSHCRNRSPQSVLESPD